MFKRTSVFGPWPQEPGVCVLVGDWGARVLLVDQAENLAISLSYHPQMKQLKRHGLNHIDVKVVEDVYLRHRITKDLALGLQPAIRW